MPLNRCQQPPAPYKRLINDVNKPTNRPTNNRRIETNQWLLTNSTRVFQPITSWLNRPITFNRPDFITSSTDNYSMPKHCWAAKDGYWGRSFSGSQKKIGLGTPYPLDVFKTETRKWRWFIRFVTLLFPSRSILWLSTFNMRLPGTDWRSQLHGFYDTLETWKGQVNAENRESRSFQLPSFLYHQLPLRSWQLRS